MTWRLLRTWPDPEMQRKAVWVAAMMDQCVAQAAELGISTEGFIAQPAEESGWGAHCIGQHNLFGIKVGSGWTGLRVYAATFEYQGNPPSRVFISDWFRDYPSFGESVADHLSFLKTNSRYAAAGVFDRKGDEAYYAALKAAGYATDPNYPANLLAVRDTIRRYFLAYMTDDAGNPYALPPPEPRTLMIGCHGADVAAVQTKLGITADGYYGPVTMAAVVAWQAAQGLAADGVVGSLSRKSLGL